MDHLIFKYLQGKLSRKEKEELENWLNESTENKVLFKNFVGHWNFSDFDIEMSRYRIWKRVTDKHRKNEVKETTFSINWTTFRRIAAVLLMVSGVTFVLVKYDVLERVEDSAEVAMIQKTATKGQKLTVKLPDGSVVKLNADSRLQYPADFQGDSRTVDLVGEAFFDVVRNPEKPFKIRSKAIEVTVLGTSFNVNSYAGLEDVVVAVRSGRVAVKDMNSKLETVLNKQEKLTLSGTDGTFKTSFISDSDFTYGWIDGYLAFNELNLEDAMKLIAKWYGVNYEIVSEKINEKKITAKFKNPTLVNVLENLAFTYEFEYEINDDNITVK